MHLAAAGGIEGCTVEQYGMFAGAGKRFDYASLKVAEKRIVVIKAVSHWELFAVSIRSLAVARNHFKTANLGARSSHCAISDLRDLDQRWEDSFSVQRRKCFQERRMRIAGDTRTVVRPR